MDHAARRPRASGNEANSDHQGFVAISRVMMTSPSDAAAQQVPRSGAMAMPSMAEV
jgi:hypothetical protein